MFPRKKIRQISIARYSNNVLLVLSGKSDPSSWCFKIGPALIFDHLWQELGKEDLKVPSGPTQVWL